jgi:4-hydroxybenzoate polyprenyltransferase
MIKNIKTLPQRPFKPFEMLLFALVALALFAFSAWELNPLCFWLGLVVATILLVYEYRLVNPSDLSKLNVAFFNMNRYIAVIVFLRTCLAIYALWPWGEL